MNHEVTSTPGAEKKDKGPGKVDRCSIRLLDDGTFILTVSTENYGHEMESSYQSVDDLVGDLKKYLKTRKLSKPEKKPDQDSLASEAKRKY